MPGALPTHPASDLQRLIALAVNAVAAPASKRAYQQALAEYLAWAQAQQRHPLLRAHVHEYLAHLRAAGRAPASINLQLAAIRKLAAEAADRGLISQEAAGAVARVRGVKLSGVRTGNWLGLPEAEQLLTAPPLSSLKGRRDRALLAVLVGCGLRRAELVRLRLADLQQREGRWVIVDLLGKGQRTRSVPMAGWTKAAIDAWVTPAGAAGYDFQTGRLFTRLDKADRLQGDSLSPGAVLAIVRHYCPGPARLAPHDLRRTFAKLAYQRGRGAALTQIQLSLGHASVQTTQRYLGLDQDLTDAPCDYLGIRLPALEV